MESFGKPFHLLSAWFMHADFARLVKDHWEMDDVDFLHALSTFSITICV